ncbi:MAG: DUF4915 domain-containing protein [Anaerolineae bacterium]|nr:DUF4915 domain-containing protein [Anaerolineae bacterium]
MNFLSRLLPQKHPVLLISFSNLQKPRSTSLLRYDTRDGSETWVDLGLDKEASISSCTGISGHDGRLYLLATRRDVTHVFAFSQASLEPLWHQALPDVKDAHSLALLGPYAYVVSTGTDEVMRYTVTDQGFNDPQVAWTPSGADHDTHHLNSVTSHQGDVYVSGFGPKKTERWSSADDGYIYNLSKDTYVKTAVYHPHTVISYRGSLYYCDSSRAAFASMDAPLVSLEGYVRGACFTSKNIVYVGTSMGRKVSKSTGIVNNPADNGEDWGFCGITRFDLTTRQQTKIDFSAHGREIYDIYHLA